MLPDPADSAQDTLRHMELIHDRRERLASASADADAAFLTQASRALSAEPDQAARDDLALALWDRYSRAALPNYTNRWTAATGIDGRTLAGMVRRRDLAKPNGPEGSWQGTWPLGPTDQRPGDLTAVVYLLLDPQLIPCYVGSTHRFTARLKRHQKDGKVFAWWAAYPCADRDAAYALEDRLLREHKPYLNRKARR